MSVLDDLTEQYKDKYGDGWERENLSEAEEREWISACYDYYEAECVRKDVYGGPYSDKAEEWFGKPFEIVQRIDYDDPGYDPISLPMWLIRIEGDDDGMPGEFAAYPEELFWDPCENHD